MLETPKIVDSDGFWIVLRLLAYILLIHYVNRMSEAAQCTRMPGSDVQIWSALRSASSSVRPSFAVWISLSYRREKTEIDNFSRSNVNRNLNAQPRLTMRGCSYSYEIRRSYPMIYAKSARRQSICGYTSMITFLCLFSLIFSSVIRS